MILLVCGRMRLLPRLRVTFFVPKVEKKRKKNNVASQELFSVPKVEKISIKIRKKKLFYIKNFTRTVFNMIIKRFNIL